MYDGLDDLWVLEHSQYSEDNGMFPFMVTTLLDSLHHNLNDFQNNNRRMNKWQIIGIGTATACYDSLAAILSRKRYDYLQIKNVYRFDEIITGGQRIPEIEGIYFLFDDRELVYIGQSKNIGKRLQTNHHVYKKGYTVGICTTSGDDERLAIEKWLIQKYEPPMNKQYLEEAR